MGAWGGSWGCVRCLSCALRRAVLLLHRGQRHKSESIDFPPCREAENCHVESTDLGTHTKTTIPPGPPRHREERREEQMQDTAAASNKQQLAIESPVGGG